MLEYPLVGERKSPIVSIKMRSNSAPFYESYPPRVEVGRDGEIESRILLSKETQSENVVRKGINIPLARASVRSSRSGSSVQAACTKPSAFILLQRNCLLWCSGISIFQRRKMQPRMVHTLASLHGCKINFLPDPRDDIISLVIGLISFLKAVQMTAE